MNKIKSFFTKTPLFKKLDENVKSILNNRLLGIKKKIDDLKKKNITPRSNKIRIALIRYEAELAYLRSFFNTEILDSDLYEWEEYLKFVGKINKLDGDLKDALVEMNKMLNV